MPEVQDRIEKLGNSILSDARRKAEEIISKMPMPRRSVIGSQNIITANNTADTGSNAPSIAR